MVSLHRRARWLCVGMVLVAAPVWAIPFNVGDVEGSFASHWTMTYDWALSKPDRKLIGAGNGGRGIAAWSDDGRLNFKRGETFSKRFEGNHTLHLQYKDSGLHLQGRYWYDFEWKDEERPFKPMRDEGQAPLARGSGIELLDAYVYRHYRWHEQPGSVRLGRQRIHWGESRFIGGGIGIINPFDYNRSHRPAMDLREAYLPVNHFYLNQNLSDRLAFEAFYALEWKPSVLEPCGSFFSRSDILGHGCDHNLVIGERLNGLGASPWGEGYVIPRQGDRQARDSGQYGISLRYFSSWRDSELAFHYLNYHSREPYFAMQRGSAIDQRPPGYRVVYPEDIRLLGVSFSTQLTSQTRLNGELSYRANMPLQTNMADVLAAGVATADAAFVSGQRRKPVLQWISGLDQVWEDVMGASSVKLRGELAWIHVNGLGSKRHRRSGQDAVFGFGAIDACRSLNGVLSGVDRSGNCVDDGYTTANAWGYRLRADWLYREVLPGLDLRPNFTWSHDVQGYSPQPDAVFEKKRKGLALGMDIHYREIYRLGVSYSNFWGGKFNRWQDRDFVSVEFGVDFP